MSCIIHLPNYPNGSYNAGSRIQGAVVCTFPGKIKIRGVVLKLKGKEHNSWEEGSGDDTNRCHGENKFLRTELLLQRQGKLGPGRFQYPFQFQLPLSIPDSFKGPYGGIEYTIDAKVDIPFAPDYTDKKEIAVINPIDLNSEEYHAYRNPTGYSETKTSLWNCQTGAIRMDVYLEKRSFVPGKAAKMRVYITNRSNTDVEMMRFKIKRTIKSFLSSPSKRHRDKTEVLTSGATSGVRARNEQTYNVDLPIPENTVVLNFRGSKLFQEELLLSVSACFAWHSNMKIKIPVVLGHNILEWNPAPFWPTGRSGGGR